MTMIYNFDTNLYARKLRAVGVPDDQVEVFIDLAQEAAPRDLVTQADLKATEARLDAKISEVRGEISEVRGEISEVRGSLSALDARLESMQTRLTMRIGGMILAATGLLALFDRFVQ